MNDFRTTRVRQPEQAVIKVIIRSANELAHRGQR
jgi:hypothetical protein